MCRPARTAQVDLGRYITQSPYCWFSRGTALNMIQRDKYILSLTQQLSVVWVPVEKGVGRARGAVPAPPLSPFSPLGPGGPARTKTKSPSKLMDVFTVLNPKIFEFIFVKHRFSNNNLSRSENSIVHIL